MFALLSAPGMFREGENVSPYEGEIIIADILNLRYNYICWWVRAGKRPHNLLMLRLFPTDINTVKGDTWRRGSM